jgi:hypothetical protein
VRPEGVNKWPNSMTDMMMMMMMIFIIKIHIKTAPTCFGLTTILMVHITDIS